eukprot:g19861.t1
MVPCPQEIQNTQERAVWDPEEDEWRIAPIALDKDGIETTDFMESMCSQCVQLPSYQQLTGSVRERQENRPQRPGSVLGLPRPTSEFTRLNRAMGDANPRYMYDSILITDLDLPERTTEDYEVHPELGDRIERALMLALSQAGWLHLDEPCRRMGHFQDDAKGDTILAWSHSGCSDQVGSLPCGHEVATWHALPCGHAWPTLPEKR